MWARHGSVCLQVKKAAHTSIRAAAAAWVFNSAEQLAVAGVNACCSVHATYSLSGIPHTQVVLQVVCISQHAAAAAPFCTAVCRV
jgi:hypothetical protein